MTAVSSMRLLVVLFSPPDSSRSWPIHPECAPAAGAGVAGAGPVGVQGHGFHSSASSVRFSGRVSVGVLLLGEFGHVGVHVGHALRLTSLLPSSMRMTITPCTSRL